MVYECLGPYSFIGSPFTHVAGTTEAVPRVNFSGLGGFAVTKRERWLSWTVDAEGQEGVGGAWKEELGRGHTNLADVSV